MEKRPINYNNIVEQTGKPTEKTYMPYASIVKNFVDATRTDYYIQCSLDKESPKWLRTDEFLDKALVCLFDNRDFIDYCLKLYRYNHDKPVENINSILKETVEDR